MKNPFPLIEGRTAKDFKEEAIKRIKRLYPEWDIEDPSDVGNILTEVFSWYAEMIAFKMNQIPEKLYENFIQMLGITPQKAVPASTVSHFRLKKDALTGFSSLKEDNLISTAGIPFRMKDSDSLAPIRLEKLYLVENVDNTMVWKESTGPYYSARFNEEGRILNQLSVCFEEPLFRHLNLKVDFLLRIPYKVKDEFSSNILKTWFSEGEYLLEVNNENLLIPLKAVEVDIKSETIEILIQGGKPEYTDANGKIWCRKIFPVDKLKKVNFHLGKASISWNNKLSPIKISHYFDSRNETPQRIGESKIYFDRGTISYFKVPEAGKFPNSRIKLNVQVENINNKKRSQNLFRWKLHPENGKEITFIPAEEQEDDLYSGRVIDNTLQFHQSGSIEFLLPAAKRMKDFADEPDGNEIYIYLENPEENDKYYENEFTIKEIMIEFSGEKSEPEEMKIYFGKDEIISSKNKTAEIHITGQAYNYFIPGIYARFDGNLVKGEAISNKLFLSFRDNISVELVQDKIKVYAYLNSEWVPFFGEVEKVFPGYGMLVSFNRLPLRPVTILGQQGYWIVFDRENIHLIDQIYENCLICEQIEMIPKEYLGQLEPVVYHSFHQGEHEILDLDCIEIWYENKKVKTLEKKDNSFYLNPIEKTIEFHGEDFVHWTGGEVYGIGILKTRGASGNAERNVLNYRGDDGNLFEFHSNIIPATGGKNAESFEELKLRIPDILTTQDKIITASDYEQAAMKFSPLINRAKATYNFDHNKVELYVLPEPEKASGDQWKGIVNSLQQYLKQKSVINTSVSIKEPAIKKIKAEIVLSIKKQAESTEDVIFRLREFIRKKISPYRIGNYTGWNFGRPVTNSAIIGMAYRFPEIAFVQEVLLYERTKDGWSEPEIQVELTDNELPVMEQIDFKIMEAYGEWDEEDYEF